MTQQERMAWFTVLVTTASMTFFALLVPIYGSTVATAAFSILAFISLTPFFVWRGRSRGQVNYDERDRAIHAKAARITGAVIWLYFWGCAMGAYWVFGEQGTIPVQLVMTVAWLAFALLWFVQGLATIILYRAGRSHAQE